MALLTRQLLAEAGLVLTANSATAVTGDTADNTDGKLIWHVSNGGTASTVASVAIVNQPTVIDPVYGVWNKSAVSLTIPAGGRAIIGPLPPFVFNNASNQVTLVCSVVTSVVVSPVKLP